MERKVTKSAVSQQREDRLKAALRANLQRRKAQARERDEAAKLAGDAGEDKES